MEKNDIIELEITDMSEDGKGIGHADGMAVFVEGAADAIFTEGARQAHAGDKSVDSGAGSEGNGAPGQVTGAEASEAGQTALSGAETEAAAADTETGAARRHAPGAQFDSETVTRPHSCVPGDLAAAKVTKVKKRFATARLAEIRRPSAGRVAAACPFFGECGGCQLQELAYPAQLELKRRQVISKLERIGGIQDPPVEETLGWSADIDGDQVPVWRYRNKAEFAVAMTRSGPVVGFRKRGSSAVVDCDDCLLQKRSVMAAAAAIREALRKHLMTVYDPRTGKGFLRGFTVKICDGTGEMMLILTCTSPSLPHAEEIVGAVADAVDGAVSDEEDFFLQSVMLEVKRGRDIHRPADKYVCIAGTRTVTDCPAGGLKFEISAPAFYQVNTGQTASLYRTAAEFADLKGGEVLFDLYCGIGTIGLSMADRAGMVVGIEAVHDAVLDANRNAVINRIVNARYYTGAAEDVLPQLFDPDSRIYADYLDPDAERVVVLDPPRGGCDERLLETAAGLGAQKIVYVSCDPGTLARDLAFLREKNYILRKCRPVDMFPMTGSIETVSLLTR